MERVIVYGSKYEPSIATGSDMTMTLSYALRLGCTCCGCPAYQSDSYGNCTWCGHGCDQHHNIQCDIHSCQKVHLLRQQLLMGRLAISVESLYDSVHIIVGVSDVTRVNSVHPRLAFTLLHLECSLLWEKALHLFHRHGYEVYNVYERILDSACTSKLSCRQVMTRIQLQYPDLVRQFIQTWSVDTLSKLCHLCPEAQHLVSSMGTLPFPYFRFWKPSLQSVVPTLPNMCYFVRDPTVAILPSNTGATWLSDDMLFTIFSGLDIPTLVKVMLVSSDWFRFFHQDSPVWKQLGGHFENDHYRDTRKVMTVVLSPNINPLIRFERLLFSWLARNQKCIPLQPQQSVAVMKKLWEKGSIPKKMLTTKTLHLLDYGVRTFPPPRAFVPVHVIS